MIITKKSTFRPELRYQLSVDYLIERFHISQISQLKILFQAVYNKNSLDLEGLDDRFQTSQFGADCIGYIAYSTEDNLKIPAAYYGVFPVITISRGKKIMCAQSGDTMTHPNHRKRGLFTKLAKKPMKQPPVRKVLSLYMDSQAPYHILVLNIN